MVPIFLGKALGFWIGVLALISLLIEITLGLLMDKGKKGIYKYHKLNAIILTVIVLMHLISSLFLKITLINY